MRFYVYVLLCKDNKYYIGYSENLKLRLAFHSCGKVHSTQNRRPLKLIHYEYFVNKKDAKAREVYLKSGAGHSQIRSMLKNTLL